uniref:Cytochrome P450 n=1 Tax=Cannabis sativa TaxID=3483 RepID=A0A803P7Q5_CANSA
MYREEGSMEVSMSNGVLARLLEEESLPDEAVADFIINLLFAGNETTAKTMLFAIYFLTHSPQALKQLLDEQESLKSCTSGDDDEEMLTWQDYKAMSFTQCVIDETLRLGGIAIWLMREAKEDVKYQDYVIPKGCFVVPFLSAVHLDEKVYNGALDFNPWRWMEPENQEKRNWRNSPFYAPFGGGARFCPGAELARLQIAFFLRYFVTTYRDLGFFYRYDNATRCKRLLEKEEATFMDEATFFVVQISLTNWHKAASLVDSSPANVPLPLRVEPKPKSGIRQQDLLRKVVEIKPKRHRVSSPPDGNQSTRGSVNLNSESKNENEKKYPLSKSEGKSRVNNPVKGLLGLAYESSDDED